MVKKTTKKEIEQKVIRPGWINQKTICSGLGISPQAFRNWGVQSISKVGREVFYSLSDIVENRIQNDRDLNNQYSNLEDAEEAELLKIEKLREEVTLLKLRNAVLEGKSLPAESVTKVMATILSRSCEIFDSLPLSIARKFPDVDNRIIGMFTEATIKHQNEVARLGDYVEEEIDEVQAEAEERIR